MISNKTYDVLKYIAQVALPLLATFYLALGGIWGIIPYPQEIAGTIMATDAFLGGLLMVSTKKYNKTIQNI